MNAIKLAGALLATLGTAQAGAEQADYATHGDEALGALIGEALDRNPRIRTALAEHAAAREIVPQVTALPDPRISVTGFGRQPETRVGPQRGGLAVTQAIPWFGKLAARGDVATSEAALRDEFVDAVRADIVARVKSAYYDLAYLDEAIRITTQQEELLRHYESLARAQYSQGIGLQQAVVKLQAQITRALNRRTDLQRRRATAEATLNVLRDRPVDSAITETGGLERPVVDIDIAALRGVAREASPDAKLAALGIDSAQAGLRLAQRRYWPDLVVGAGWANVAGRRDDAGRSNPPPDNGKDTLNFTVGVNIPVFRSRIDAGVREAKARVSAAREAHRGTLLDVDLAIRTIGLELTTVDEQIALYENALLQQAEQALRSTEEAYSTGTTGVLDLLDSEEVLLEVRLGLARLESDYLKALARMERAIGRAFPARRQP